MPILIIKALLSTYLKNVLWTIAGVVGAIFLSFYFLGWWGIITSIIAVPLILFFSLGYIINQIKKNPMMMFQSMVMGTPGMSSFLNEGNINAMMGSFKGKKKMDENELLADVEIQSQVMSAIFIDSKDEKVMLQTNTEIEDVESRDVVKIAESNLKTKAGS